MAGDYLVGDHAQAVGDDLAHEVRRKDPVLGAENEPGGHLTDGGTATVAGPNRASYRIVAR
jgi:hypothetical protein